MTKGWKSQVLVPVHLALAIGLLAGCSTKSDPNEVLDLCGNHSCGSLAMVTTDTSSNGYQYLEPVMTDDGSMIYFTADYGSLIPAELERDPPDPMPRTRQIMFVPVREGVTPVRKLSENGASLVRYFDLRYHRGGELRAVDDRAIGELQKGSPQILGDKAILVWMGLERGARLVKLDFSEDFQRCRPETLYQEPEDYRSGGGYWQHRDPSVSPDRKWVAFSRFGHGDRVDSLSAYTQQQIWVVSTERGAGAPRPRAFPVTTEAAIVGGPAWSPDGRTLAFHAGLGMAGESGGSSGTEIFTISFDTTGLAVNRGVPLNRDLRRITFSGIAFGNPMRGIQNTKPVFTNDGTELVFISTLRAPSITLYDRNIWRVPADGRLDPQILFFTRADDVDPCIPRGSSSTLLLSSSIGFPTELLARIEEEMYQQYLEQGLTGPEARVKAQQKRRDLEFFERVMSHLYVFRGWQ